MKTTIMLTLVTAFLGMGLTTQAEARHGRSSVYISGYRSCGTPIYTMRYLVGYDHCGRPIWRYRVVIRDDYDRPRERYCAPSYRYDRDDDRDHHRHNYRDDYRTGGSRVRIEARF